MPAKKPVKNFFDIIQVKKMIGKGLICQYKALVYDKKKMAGNVEKMKKQLLEGKVRSISLCGFVSGGVIYIINNIERLFVIQFASYLELKEKKLENIEICIIQYPKLTKEEIYEICGNKEFN